MDELQRLREESNMEVELRNGKGTPTKRDADEEASWSADDSSSGMRSDSLNQTRGVWANRMEFFLSIMGYTVGIGSVWRFPMLCSRNGGGVFLIPFFIFLFLAGWPLYYLEVCLGQFTGRSAGLAFQYCLLLKGLGFLQLVISLITSWYAVLILAWVYYYLYSSFMPTLPWSTCDNWWNTPNCKVFSQGESTFMNQSARAIEHIFTTVSTQELVTLQSVSQNNSLQEAVYSVSENTPFSSASFEFWSYNTLRKSTGIEDVGSIQIHLVICFFLAWLTIILAICRGVKSLGKVVYVTATMPFLLLAVMLVRGATLDGALDGVIFFLKPDLSKLFVFQVWMEAAQQVFFSLGPSWGGVITMASFNKFHQKSYLETTMCVLCSGFSSIFNGLVVFTTLGFMAKQSDSTVQEVATQSGAGLIFVVFPAALSEMPLPQLWSVLFFLAMLTVVFDSLFGGVEVVSSAIIDLFPRQLLNNRVKVNMVIGVVMFLLGLPFTTNAGIYILQVADWYFSIFALLLGSGLEAVSIGWIYGVDRFCEDIRLMTGRDVSRLFRFLWLIPIPIMLLFTFIITLVGYKAPNYGDGYVYPEWSIALAIFGGMSPIIAMVAVGLNEAVKVRWSLKKLLRPSAEWVPNDSKAKLIYVAQPYVYETTLYRRLKVNLFGR